MAASGCMSQQHDRRAHTCARAARGPRGTLARPRSRGHWRVSTWRRSQHARRSSARQGQSLLPDCRLRGCSRELQATLGSAPGARSERGGAISRSFARPRRRLHWRPRKRSTKLPSGGPLTPYAQLGSARRSSRGQGRGVAHACERRGSRQLRVRAGAASHGRRRSSSNTSTRRDRDLAELPGRVSPSPGWIQVVLRMSDAVLEGRPDAARAESAALLARRVVVERPPRQP